MHNFEKKNLNECNVEQFITEFPDKG